MPLLTSVPAIKPPSKRFSVSSHAHRLCRLIHWWWTWVVALETSRFGFAGLFPKARIIGIDGAESMLAVARERAQQQQLEISFLCQTLQEVLRGALLGQADLIVSNSLLHHLHQPDLLWMVTRDLAAPGCRTLHRDLRRPASDAEIQQLLLKHLPSAPEVLQHDFAASLAAAFEPQEVTAELHRLDLNELTVSAEDDRYLVVSGLVKS